MTDPKHLHRAAEIAAQAQTFSHPWNPKSQIHGVRLGFEAGLVRTGVNFARLSPGKESFAYHAHAYEEEWIYVLSGRGLLEIDGQEHEVGEGDFAGFPPGVAHHLRNPFLQEFVYLMGGEAKDHEVADFPKLGLRMVRRGEDIDVYRLDSGKRFPERP